MSRKVNKAFSNTSIRAFIAAISSFVCEGSGLKLGYDSRPENIRWISSFVCEGSGLKL
ncbi:hypothetical protein LEP1GSC186_1107 [Leptospira noguchii serovar Autumnalis str. ZUN142]|uniref:Uncharacterized protein n=1 Tax=Leptospira noguchii serovar Autumnalis str. ZUN142 TaxID=1085540 RepID=M6UQG5_9LEPT|nr:hypothetical protein LEP1GSC186_1107 [Leptospira noguchii serovar Autumnalis str. ZUN142]